MYHIPARPKNRNQTLIERAVKILKATIGLISNREGLLPRLPFPVEVKSLLTDFMEVSEIPYADNLDGYVTVEETPGELFYKKEGEDLRIEGPFLELIRTASDLRYSLWGNLGFLCRYTLYLLEKKHRIHNFHACALFDEPKNRLFLILGAAGSGKTVYLLSGLLRGLKLFSTETVHVQIKQDQVTWFMGSLVDNVRWGTLIHDFPDFLPGEPPPARDHEWQSKIALDLSSYRANPVELANLESVVVLLPHIEQGRLGFHLSPIKDPRQAAQALFDNVSQRLTETVILYDRLPLLGFEEKGLAETRLAALRQLVHHESISQVAAVLANPRDCWGDLLD